MKEFSSECSVHNTHKRMEDGSGKYSIKSINNGNNKGKLG
jgi:hypothetical protein